MTKTGREGEQVVFVLMCVKVRVQIRILKSVSVHRFKSLFGYLRVYLPGFREPTL